MRKPVLFQKPGILILTSVLILSACKSRQTDDRQDTADSVQVYVEPEIQVPEEPQIIPCTEEDSLSLVAFFNATHGDEWLDPWTFDDPVFYWEGITLSDEGIVTEISLPDFNIQGILPEELGNLTELKVLDLDNNPVTGEILLLDYKYGEDAFYERRTYNDFEPNFEENQLNWFTAYVYHPEGLEIYATPEISDENSIGSFGQGEVANLLEPLNADPHDMTEIDGYYGCMRPVDLGNDTAWIFSGYLCKLPLPEDFMHDYFSETIRLLYTLEVEGGYQKQDGELITNDEDYTYENITQLEYGISIVGTSAYAGGGTSVCFDLDFWDIQEVYLFADAYRGGEFTEKFGRSFPGQARKDTIILSEDTMEILTVRINEEDGSLEEISISLEDTGYFEELSISVGDEEICLNWGGGG